MTMMGAATNPGQAIENLPSSILGIASAFGKTPAKALAPAYGLTFRFQVKIDEVHGSDDLGKWSSCKGLKMKFEPMPIRSGGNYVSQQYLPGDLTYEKIILSRAVEPKSSEAVQKWIQAAAVDWINGTDKPNAGGGWISLLDAAGKEVLTWFLAGVRPVAWSGPDLDATAGKVAIETLELVHEGFNVVAGPMPIVRQPQIPQSQPVTLRNRKNNEEIKFFNAPKEISVERTTDDVAIPLVSATSPQEGDGEGAGQQQLPVVKANVTRLTLNDMYLIPVPGQTVAARVQKLIDWMGTGSLGAANKQQEVAAAELVVQWGKFLKVVKLTGLTAHYVRFGADGLPIRAKLKLVLTTVPPPPVPPRTNPTSGGIPGRRAHNLVSDESLPLLAHHTYGNTAHWRDIAEANGMDDPLRTRPGNTIFLPSPDELPRRGEH